MLDFGPTESYLSLLPMHLRCGSFEWLLQLVSFYIKDGDDNGGLAVHCSNS